MKNVSLLTIMRLKPPVLAGDRLVLFGVSLLLAALFLFSNIHNANAGISFAPITHAERKTEWKPTNFHDFVRELKPDDLNCINLTNNNKIIRALLIGAHEYYGEHRLMGPPNDVVLIQHALEAKGVLPENIQVRIKGTATRETVIKDFSHLLQESQCGDELVLFLSSSVMLASVEGISGERWPIKEPELKEIITENRQQPVMILEDAWTESGIDISRSILATELQIFVKALRIKGIDVVVIIDGAYSSQYELEATTRSTWECCADEQIFQQKSVYGRLTTFYSPRMANDENFDDKAYGVFSFWVGTALSQPKLVTVKDIIQNIYTSYKKYLVQKMGDDKKTAIGELPSFSSSDPNRPILRSLNAPIATENFTITLDTPKKTRGVPLLPAGKLTGQINPNDGLIAVVVLGKIATLSEDGAFTVELPLKRGENLVDIMAVYDNRRHHVEQIVVHSNLGKYEVTQSPRTYALLIGNQNYSPESGFENLETPHRDIDALKTLLSERYGMQTYIENPNNTQHSLVIRDASREDIYNALRIIAEVAEKDDSVLIYYAGHGKTIDLNEDKKLAYWIPANARIDVEAADWISANDINDLVARIQARHVLVIADSCYSGVLAETRDKTSLVINEKNRDRYLSEMSKKKSRYLVSSGGDEPVSDGGGDGHSIFARTLLTALEKPLAPIFTVEQVFHDKIKQSVANNSQQVPQMQVIHDTGHDNGSFVFFKKVQ